MNATNNFYPADCDGISTSLMQHAAISSPTIVGDIARRDDLKETGGLLAGS